MNEATEKFIDKGENIYDFGDEFLVVCPKCSSLAKVSADNSAEKCLKTAEGEFINQIFSPRKFVCLHCPYRKTWNDNRIVIGNKDWYFNFSLWLEINCCGENLWAYNKKHLEFIENYVSAKLRARQPNINESLASRLPKWMKSAKNRDEILKAIVKLKEKLNGKF